MQGTIYNLSKSQTKNEQRFKCVLNFLFFDFMYEINNKTMPGSICNYKNIILNIQKTGKTRTKVV